MPGNKKPSKKFKQRDVVRPLNMRNRWLTEGSVHAALLALEGGTFEEQHLADLVAHADVVHRIAAPGTPEQRQAETIIRMCGLVLRRGEYRVLPMEEVAIRAATKITAPFLQGARNHDILRAAKASMADQNRWGGVRL